MCECFSCIHVAGEVEDTSCALDWSETVVSRHVDAWNQTQVLSRVAKKTALLKCNQYTIQLVHLQCCFMVIL